MASTVYTYAVIQSGIVQNIAIVNPGDVMDSSFVWVDVTEIIPQPQAGWTYDGTNFVPPGLPDDAYGNQVTAVINQGGLDIYTIGGSSQYSFPTGTSESVVYLTLAIKENLAQFNLAVMSYIYSHYTDQVRITLIGLYLNAQSQGLTNRLAYITQILVWQDAVIAYAAYYAASIQVLTNPVTVASTTWNFSDISVPDPMITPMGAIAIVD